MQLNRSASLKSGGGLVTPESKVSVVGMNCNKKVKISVPQVPHLLVYHFFFPSFIWVLVEKYACLNIIVVEAARQNCKSNQQARRMLQHCYC